MEKLQTLTPTKVDSFVGNKISIRNIRSFLSSKAPEKNILCIMGPNGCGKTILTNLLFLEMNLHVLNIEKDTLVGQDMKTILNNFMNNLTIDSFFNKRQKIVFIDDIDILVCVDKCIYSKVMNCNTSLKDKNIKIVITSSLQEEKRVNEHAKDIECIKLYHPSIKDSYAYILGKFDEHNIEYDDGRLLEIVSKNKGSIRESVFSLDSTSEELREKEMNTAFRDMNVFEASKKILQKRHNKTDLDGLIYGDAGNIPYILYENFPIEVDVNYKLGRGKKAASLIDHYLRINDHFITSSVFEDFAFKTQNWGYLVYANNLKFGSIHEMLDTLDKKATTKDVQYKFSQLISKISHKNIMGKKLKGISNSTHDISNTNLIMASDAHAQRVLSTDVLEKMGELQLDTKEKPQTKTKAKSKSTAKATTKTGTTKKKGASTKAEQKNVNEQQSIIKTYEKYFI